MEHAIGIVDHPDGVVIAVWVVPGTAQDEIVGAYGDALKLRVSAPAEGGKANRSVERLLGAAFQCRAELVSGARNRRKRVLLRGMRLIDVRSGLSDLLTATRDC